MITQRGPFKGEQWTTEIVLAKKNWAWNWINVFTQMQSHFYNSIHSENPRIILVISMTPLSFRHKMKSLSLLKYKYVRIKLFFLQSRVVCFLNPHKLSCGSNSSCRVWLFAQSGHPPCSSVSEINGALITYKEYVLWAPPRKSQA